MNEKEQIEELKKENCKDCLYRDNFDDNTCGACKPNSPQSRFTPKEDLKGELITIEEVVKPTHFSNRYNKLCPYCSGIFKTTKEGDYICSKCSSIFREYLVCIGERVVPK